MCVNPENEPVTSNDSAGSALSPEGKAAVIAETRRQLGLMGLLDGKPSEPEEEAERSNNVDNPEK